MTPEQRADAYNATWPERPPLVTSGRWLYVMTLFPNAGRVLHLFSGTVSSPGSVSVDLVRRGPGCPSVLADACHLPFADGTFDLALADPPYSAPDAEKYGTPMVNRRKALREIARVTSEGGHLVWLDTVKPMYRNADWRLFGEVAVLRSTNHRVRCSFMFERVVV
jgi:SAM-dependent methyltransferase